MKTIKIFVFLTIASVFFIYESMAQCAMCRVTVENNVSNGETSFAAGLNMGILYLFITPYLLIAVIAILWYRNARKKKPVSGWKLH